MELRVYNVDEHVLFFSFLGEEQVGHAVPLRCWSWQVCVQTPDGTLIDKHLRLPWQGVLLTPLGRIPVQKGQPNQDVARGVIASLAYLAGP
ncbi:MAG: hypothetical protein H7Y22_15980 [Gemmatimonadaceae bacterium]|nr:hypothetical protein [Gloeobacterales cyanobacterium ES-bin-141]